MDRVKSAAFSRWIVSNFTLCICVVFNVVNCLNQTMGIEQDYCESENFSPSCPPGEVIIMKTAKYGRMAISRCITRDFGYIGCSVDVMPELDHFCSGRQLCQIPVPNSVFRRALYGNHISNCPKDLSPYLAVSFHCVKVETADSQQCDSTADIVPSSPISGILSSYVTMETDKGSNTCPWVIALNHGQKVNITLYDFARVENRVSGGSDNITLCEVYAVIRERTDSDVRSMEHSVCGGSGGDRERTVFVGEGHSLEISIVKYPSSVEQKYFLLKYEVSGCENPQSGDWNSGNNCSRGSERKVNKWMNLISGAMVIGIAGLLQ